MEILKAALQGLLYGDWRDSHPTVKTKEKYLSMVDQFCNGFLNFRNFSNAEKEKLAALARPEGTRLLVENPSKPT